MIGGAASSVPTEPYDHFYLCICHIDIWFKTLYFCNEDQFRRFFALPRRANSVNMVNISAYTPIIDLCSCLKRSKKKRPLPSGD